MASNDGSIETNAFPMHNTPYLNTWDGFGNYGDIPSAPATETTASAVSAGVESQPEPAQRVASPGTQARQQELGRLILAERQKYLENANSSEAGSAMDRHMLNYMRELEEVASVTAPQATSSTTSHTNTTNVTNNGSYFNLHGGLLNDERRIRVGEGRNATGHTNGSNNQVQDFDAISSLGQGSNVEESISRAGQRDASNDHRQPSFTQIDLPGSSNYGGQSNMGQIGQPDSSNTHAQSNIGRLGESSSTNGQRQSNVGRLGQPTCATDQGQYHVGRRGQPIVANDQGPSKVGRLNQPTSANDQRLSTNQPRSNLRGVNFTSGIYGRITQIEQTNPFGYDGHAVVTSARANSSNSSAHATFNDVTSDLTNGLDGHIYNSRNGSNISQASSTSTLRRRAAFSDLAYEAGHERTAFEHHNDDDQDAEGPDTPNITDSSIFALPPLSQTARQENARVEGLDQDAAYENNVNAVGGARTQTNIQGASIRFGTSGTTPAGSPPTGPPPFYVQHAAVESAPPSVTAMPEVSQATPVAAHSLPIIATGVPHNFHAAANGAQNAGVNENRPNVAIPPHLDINDPVGFDIMTALHNVGRLRNSINGLGAERTATEQVLAELNVITTGFVTGFRRAAAAARNHREAHQLTNGLLSRARLAARAIQVEYGAVVEAVERAEERAALSERREDLLRADLTAAVLARARAAAVEAQRSVRLAERRRENGRLQGEVTEMERVMYGHN
jgi:hypothetical protein